MRQVLFVADRDRRHAMTREAFELFPEANEAPGGPAWTGRFPGFRLEDRRNDETAKETP